MMIQKSKLFLVLAIGVWLVSCTNEKLEERKTLSVKVMEVHDEVMPKMTQINLHLENIEAELETFENDTTRVDSVRVKALIETQAYLEKASDGMNTWMQNFQIPSLQVKDDDAIVYLNNELQAISQVAVDMNGSILQADSLFNN